MADSTTTALQGSGSDPGIIDIRPLLQRLWPDPAKENVTAQEISEAISHIFSNRLSPVQTGSLLTALHFTAWDRRPDVLAEASAAMRRAAAEIDLESLRAVVAGRGRPEGKYNGGLVCLSTCPSFACFSFLSPFLFFSPSFRIFPFGAC